jgi:nicotinamidase-related amidase
MKTCLIVIDAQESFRHSALVGTDLPVWLVENGIQKLIASGIRTEQCCETTTRHASDLGWQVDYVLDATLSFDMTFKSWIQSLSGNRGPLWGERRRNSGHLHGGKLSRLASQFGKIFLAY